jgi:hypothetical protein
MVTGLVLIVTGVCEVGDETVETSAAAADSYGSHSILGASVNARVEIDDSVVDLFRAKPPERFGQVGVFHSNDFHR